MSHPVWVRGLKPIKRYTFNLIAKVAPRVGAWIETKQGKPFPNKGNPSHPVWVRGLKLGDVAHFLVP